MASFTSAQNGNWNDGATWGNTSPGTEGVDWPSTSGGDTVTVSAGHEVTIPSSHNATASGTLADGSSGDHTKLIVAGSLDLDGNLILNDYCELNLNGGSTLDLNGNNVVCGVDAFDEIWLNFQGSSGSRVTVESTGAAGAFSYGNNATIHNDSDYVDYSGLATSFLAASYGNAASTATYHWCTFTDCGQLYLCLNPYAEQSYAISHCDFRNPSATAVRVAYISASGTPSGSPARQVEYCTFSALNGNYGKVYIDGEGGVFEHNVVKDWMVEIAEPDVIIQHNFFDNTLTPVDAITSPLGGGDFTFQHNFVYASGVNAHPLSSYSNYYDNVLEGVDTQTNWVIPNSSDCDILRNILLGAGSLFCASAATSYDYNIKHNTLYAPAASTGAAMLLVTKGGSTVLSGTVEIADNLIVDADTTSNNTGVFLEDTSADQITSTDYNCWYGYDGGDLYDHYYNVSITGKTEGVDAGFGGNDLNLDPQFVDKTRNLAAWDSALGGAGTAANAVAELLKLNGYGGTYDSNYAVTDLLAYIRAGFTPQNSALAGAASDSGDIGAVAVATGGGSASIINQLQGANLGSDLFNGTIL